MSGSTLAIALVASLVWTFGCSEESPASPPADAGAETTPADAESDAEADADQPDPPVKRILFGDLHVHSTHSLDAMVTSMPLLDGAGLTGPAQRCDFARFCSQLDFWAITDHPEVFTPAMWTDTKEAIRTCNDLTGGREDDPEMVSFVGWEWTQTSTTLSNDWGHKNVIFREDGDDQVPSRPIAAPSSVITLTDELVDLVITAALSLDPANEEYYQHIADRTRDALAVEVCPADVDTRELPTDCREVAQDPAELFAKLDEWGFDALVIPHGNTWGTHHPALASWAPQLNSTQHDPKYQRLAEIYSGHGNMEEYRPWRHAVPEPDGTLSCPEPTPEFLPCCWRAGELVRAQSDACQTEPEGDACAGEVAAARQAYVDADMTGWKTVDGATPEDWLDCGQCRDCWQPPFMHRPAFSLQGAMASTWEPDGGSGAGGARGAYRFGFVGSTDSHVAGSGAGYKEFRKMSDNFGPSKPEVDPVFNVVAPMYFPEYERQNNYWFSGGLIAVHATGRDRATLWDAMMRREVYATSGERMLLWFDLTNGPDGEPLPMGSEVALDAAPEFEVRAVGSFKQAPGCPPDIVASAPDGFVESGCFGECYNPTDERYLLTRIEVVKITPQITADEPIEPLITDPLLTLPCAPDPEGCTVTFSDPDFVAGSRPALYYVRAIQEPTLQFNAGTLRCEVDASGECISIELCPGGYDKVNDDCLAEDEERAWSSPIFVDPA